VLKIGETAVFARWFGKLKDRQARFRIAVRLRHLRDGNLGDVKPAGEGVSELRINYGPGYRVYLVLRGSALIILLCGGDKGTQVGDIARAKKLAKEAIEWKEWQ
jgi:putative addiction module killer protein